MFDFVETTFSNISESVQSGYHTAKTIIYEKVVQPIESFGSSAIKKAEQVYHDPMQLVPEIAKTAVPSLIKTSTKDAVEYIKTNFMECIKKPMEDAFIYVKTNFGIWVHDLWQSARDFIKANVANWIKIFFTAIANAINTHVVKRIKSLPRLLFALIRKPFNLIKLGVMKIVTIPELLVDKLLGRTQSNYALYGFLNWIKPLLLSTRSILSQLESVQDVVADHNAPLYRYSPILGFIQDVLLVFARVLPCPHHIFVPFKIGQASADVSFMGMVFQIVLTIWSLTVFLPLGLIGLTTAGVTPIAFAYMTAWPLLKMQGSPFVQIPVEFSSVSPKNRLAHQNESWVFINGICTSQSGVKLIVRHLESLFQRPVVGLHNRTLGPFFDLLECIIQRDLNYLNTDVRRGFKEVKKRLQNPDIKKVVLIGHSQGGIIVSLLVDQLLDDLASEHLEKLEVYTFASAANHFSDPLVKSENASIVQSDHSGSLRVQPHEGRVPRFKHVEHYANGKDPVSQIGVLAYCKPHHKINHCHPTVISTHNRFTGRIFVRAKVSGHMLLSHYLGKNSILKTPEAIKYSRLRRYFDGASPSDDDP